ncbi:MAG: isochorismatase family protein [Candidatus Rokubacteria bacterium]|nr:isochorismatase family protein [Candidatus Rokubacteria bacterium]
MPQPVLVIVDVQERLFNAMDAERALLGDTAPIEKTAFSCCGAAGFTARLRELGPGRVLLAGMEAHVCVLLTALDLLGQGVPVSVVADAVCSRTTANLELGLAQARQAGAVVTATETVVFQFLGGADTDAFRELSKLLR